MRRQDTFEGPQPRALAAGAALLFLLLFGACSATAVELSFEPETFCADSAEVFNLAVIASDLDSLRGYQVEIEFDADLIDFVDADPGELFTDYVPYGLYWAVSDEDSVLSIQCLILPDNECEAGPGEILVLTFVALGGPGIAELSITDATVRDCDGTPLEPINTHDGKVIVEAVADLFFNPDPKYVLGEGVSCEIALEVTTIDSLRGFQVRLNYEADVLDYDSAHSGDLISPPAIPDLWWYVLEESPGLLRVEGVVLGPGIYVNGPGELIKLSFTALVDQDTTTIEFDEWHLWDVNTDEFTPVGIDNGLIIIDVNLQNTPEIRPDTDAHLILEPLAHGEGTVFAFACSYLGSSPPRASVHAITGRQIKAIAVQPTGPQRCRIVWKGRRDDGVEVPTGVYLLRVVADRQSLSKKMFVLH